MWQIRILAELWGLIDFPFTVSIDVNLMPLPSLIQCCELNRTRYAH